MPIIRNPFRKTPADIFTDPNGQPVAAPLPSPSSAFPQRPSTDIVQPQPTEYELSKINDSGVFLPPSPSADDKPRFWTMRSTTSTSSSSYRSALSEDDNPFTISRESFDSYRRSFDICARSPVPDPDASWPRQSLDAARLRVPPPRLSDAHINPPEAQPEERFEDVGLGDDTARPKKQGIFARFGGHGAPVSHASEAPRPATSHSSSQLFPRRRAASGSSPAELRRMS